ncbi:hypothetical protein [Phyllobacterium sp. YR531]|uniref:hypothetical protein n=1 Tax=Phyllobacterium sp. YR531 TaxID=1144343 RepID=UPI0002EA60C2|nr:hypothetical protein [Phyllobacterium sp. YR531]
MYLIVALVVAGVPSIKSMVVSGKTAGLVTTQVCAEAGVRVIMNKVAKAMNMYDDIRTPENGDRNGNNPKCF